MSKKTLYFLCTGNSCRSQIVEGFGKKYLGEKYEVYSAGIEAHGLNFNAVKVMKEVDIDISKQTSDIIDQEILNKADYVITLCGDANDKCPMTPSHITRCIGDLTTQRKQEEQKKKNGLFFNEYEMRLDSVSKSL